jgi:hypothetical protein
MIGFQRGLLEESPKVLPAILMVDHPEDLDGFLFLVTDRPVSHQQVYLGWQSSLCFTPT